MKRTRNLLALMMVITAVAAPSLFAEPRHREQTNGGVWRGDQGRTLALEGRIRDIDRDRNGFVIRLDRGRYRLFAPVNVDMRGTYDWGNRGRNRDRNRVRDLEVGDYIRVSGTLDSRDIVYVRSIQLLRDEDNRRDRNDRFLSGVVQSVDAYRGTFWLRDERSGRVIGIDARDVDRNLSRLRRGDRVTVRGDWRRDGRFEAERVQVDGRY